MFNHCHRREYYKNEETRLVSFLKSDRQRRKGVCYENPLKNYLFQENAKHDKNETSESSASSSFNSFDDSFAEYVDEAVENIQGHCSMY